MNASRRLLVAAAALLVASACLFAPVRRAASQAMQHVAALVGSEQIPLGYPCTVSCYATTADVAAYVQGLPAGVNSALGSNLVANGGFILDQEYEGSGPTPSSSTALRVADRWYAQWVVSTSGAGNPTVSQAAVSTGLTLSPKELKIAANSSAGSSAPAALNFIVYQSVEGDSIADLQEGTANGEAFTVRLRLKGSAAGTYGVYVQDGGGSYSFVHNCAVTTGWSVCSFVVPGTGHGTWNSTPGSVGMVVGVAAACGSTFQTTADTWQSGVFDCTASQTELTNTASATLELDTVTVQRGQVANEWVAEPASLLLLKAERFYRKSFLQGTAPAQNAGAGTGESCFQNPIANGEGSITLTYPRMYAAPTVTTFNPGAANANFRDETGAADVTAGTAVGTPTSTFLPTAATVATIAHKVCVHWTLDAGA